MIDKYDKQYMKMLFSAVVLFTILFIMCFVSVKAISAIENNIQKSHEKNCKCKCISLR